MALSVRSLLSFTNGLISQIPFINHLSSPTTTLTGGSSCPSNSPLSCHNSTAAPNSCCFIYPGGQLLQTQFWDTSPSIGPLDSWTLHGLWPDLCDGSYPTYCTSAPTYNNITSILTHYQQTPLLSSMLKYWLPNSGTTEHFWEHEWNKHGTCINTLSPSCYTPYSIGVEVVDFFAKAVALFQSLDTYQALAEKGIVPDRERVYRRAEIEDALMSITGTGVVVRCVGNRLNEVWYSFNVKGSLQGGGFVAAEPAGKWMKDTCPERGIRYLPKANSKRRYEG